MKPNERVVGAVPTALLDAHGAWRAGAQGARGSALVVATEAGVRAWANACPHWDLPLDATDGTFWDAASKELVCGAHGARFCPRTGRCVDGPCPGGMLRALDVRVEEDRVVVIDVDPDRS